MSMSMTPGQLQAVVDKVKEIDGLGISVKMIEVEGHDIYLRTDSSGRNGHSIVGITNKTKYPSGEEHHTR